jgi:phosphatidylethanolamine/phosphatidyl-N-methylethanolamine N-methyltransferase
MGYKEYNDEVFSRWAPIYDIFELVLSDIREKIVQQINPGNKTVLDVATGTGSLAMALSKSAKSVTGIDLSANMLEIAKKKPVKANLTFLQMDASKMTFEDESFDIVTISLGLHDMPLDVRTLVLQEIKRVMKKDGKLYIMEHDLPKNEIIAKLSSDLINILEGKYYLDFIRSDLDEYLKSFGFKIENNISYGFQYLRLIALSK